MPDEVLNVRAADRLVQGIRHKLNDDNSLTKHHLEDPEQRLELLTALEAFQDAFADAVGEISATPAANTLQDRLKTLATLVGEVQANPTANTVQARLKSLLTGIVLAAGTNLIGKVAPSADQDPIFNEAQGVKVALTANTSTDVIIPPAGCKFVLVSVTADTVFATDNPTNVADDGKSVMVFAGTEKMLPVTPTVKVKAISTSASTVRAMPMKERP